MKERKVVDEGLEAKSSEGFGDLNLRDDETIINIIERK